MMKAQDKEEIITGNKWRGEAVQEMIGVEKMKWNKGGGHIEKKGPGTMMIMTMMISSENMRAEG